MSAPANLAHETAKRAMRTAIAYAPDCQSMITAASAVFDVQIHELAAMGVGPTERVNALTRALAIAIHNSAPDDATARLIAESAGRLMQSQLRVLIAMKIERVRPATQTEAHHG